MRCKIFVLYIHPHRKIWILHRQCNTNTSKSNTNRKFFQVADEKFEYFLVTVSTSSAAYSTHYWHCAVEKFWHDQFMGDIYTFFIVQTSFKRLVKSIMKRYAKNKSAFYLKIAAFTSLMLARSTRKWQISILIYTYTFNILKFFSCWSRTQLLIIITCSTELQSLESASVSRQKVQSLIQARGSKLCQVGTEIKSDKY